MSNDSYNSIMFQGDVISLGLEIDTMINVQQKQPQRGVLPTEFRRGIGNGVPHESDYIFNLEKLSDSHDKFELCLIYKSNNSISLEVLNHLASRHSLEFKGTFTGEDESLESCGYVTGVTDQNGVLQSACVTLNQCGIVTEPEDEEQVHEFMCNAVDILSDIIFFQNKQINKSLQPIEVM